MTHHTHSMQCRLSIEQNIVSILQSPLNNSTVRYKFLYLLRSVVYLYQIYYLLLLLFVLRRSDDVFHLALFAQLYHPAVIYLCHLLRNRQRSCYLLWNAQLVKGQIRVRTDHTPSRKINSLAHQMLPEPSLFGFQPLLNTLNFLHHFLLLTTSTTLRQIYLIHLHHNRVNYLLHLLDLALPVDTISVCLYLVVYGHDPHISTRYLILRLLLGIHLDRWTNLRWSNRQSLDQQVQWFRNSKTQ